MNNEMSLSQRPLFCLGSRVLRLADYQSHSLLSQFVETLLPYSDDNERNAAVDIELSWNQNGVICHWYQDRKKPLQLSIDITKFVKQQRSYPAAKQGALNQALGRKSKSIIDATGGWGGDALLFWSQGYDVTVLERNPLMALLLRDAMHRLATTEWAESIGRPVPRIISTDARDYFFAMDTDSIKSIDCVYFDPMFPAKSKTSAGVNKRIQFLQYLVGADEDAERIVRTTLNKHLRRVVVKRPHHSLSLVRKPDEQFVSKLVHYDVYLATN